MDDFPKLPVVTNNPTKIPTVVPKKRTELLKWDGWGYKDSKFYVKDEIVHFMGDRYPLGSISLPYFTEFVKDRFDLQVSDLVPTCDPPSDEKYPNSEIPQEFLEEMNQKGISWSDEGMERLIRSRGQTLHDIFTMRFGLKAKSDFPRIPDVVVWPESHDDVEHIVQTADKLGVVVIPYGGGTSVSGAVTCPQNEPRPICSLDTSQMNTVFWLDKNNLLLCCQCGITGQDLEAFLNPQGLTVGHEPDSYEFSTVGGWVATRASGMKKNVYGNIEDLLMSVKLVSTQGVLVKAGYHPRQSTGPDLNHIVLGSEGTLGVITEVVLKVRPLPGVRKFGSIVFPDFEAGVGCMREVARQRCQPASIRLIDNEQFKLGHCLRPKVDGFVVKTGELFKKVYLTMLKRFDMDRICVATLLFEGDRKSLDQQEEKIYTIAKQFGGIAAGEKNGERGYMLTFVIAYVRDLALDFQIVAESFETSVPWNQTLSLIRNVKYVLAQECKKKGVEHYLISARVTQTYDAGCCVYFYFGFKWAGLDDPVGTYEAIEAAARDEIIISGGSLSHHHGVGKLRARWYPGQISHLGEKLYKQAKLLLDPNNVFAVGNLIPESKL